MYKKLMVLFVLEPLCQIFSRHKDTKSQRSTKKLDNESLVPLSVLVPLSALVPLWQFTFLATKTQSLKEAQRNKKMKA